jgi:hypothetical protein
MNDLQIVQLPDSSLKSFSMVSSIAIFVACSSDIIASTASELMFLM